MLKYTESQIIEALEKCAGVVSHAAKALGTSRTTVDQRVKRNPHLQAKLEEIRESNLDIAESKLFELIRKGQPSAIIFFGSSGESVGERGFCGDGHRGDQG